jgi:hypothetical protein
MKLPSCLLLLTLALAAQPDWTDRAEYDLALGLRQESSPAARLTLLAAWKAKYPKSAWRSARAEMTLASAEAVGDRALMLEAARELLAADANHPTGLYWLTVLTPSTAAPTPAQLSETEAAARRLATQAAIPAPQKAAVQTLAHRALGWAAWHRQDLTTAEKELRAALALTPRHAEISGWLGAVLAIQKEPARQIASVWHLARAAYLDGEGALDTTRRSDVRSLLEAAYLNYHGSLDGLEEIGTTARAAVDPPAAFKIETAAETAERKADEELAKTNPQLLTWVQLKRRLTGANGEARYAEIAGKPLPLLKAYVIRCDRDAKPTEAALGLLDSTTEEIVLKFDPPLARCAETGLAVEFEGTPVALTRDPFRLTVTVAGDALQGWPRR